MSNRTEKPLRTFDETRSHQRKVADVMNDRTGKPYRCDCLSEERPPLADRADGSKSAESVSVEDFKALSRRVNELAESMALSRSLLDTVERDHISLRARVSRMGTRLASRAGSALDAKAGPKGPQALVDPQPSPEDQGPEKVAQRGSEAPGGPIAQTPPGTVVRWRGAIRRYRVGDLVSLVRPNDRSDGWVIVEFSYPAVQGTVVHLRSFNGRYRTMALPNEIMLHPMGM